MSAINYQQLSHDYERIEQAIRYLQSHHQEQPTLREMAQSVDLSEYHFQRIFTRWAGISPKRFMQYLTKEHAKHLLAQSGDLLNVSYATGLSGPGRLHDLFVTCEAVTPGEYKRLGEGVEFSYAIHPSPFGDCLVALSGRGVSNLIFVQDSDTDAAIRNLFSMWPAAKFIEDSPGTGAVIDEMMELFQSRSSSPLRLHLKGTNFQIKVWEALLLIPTGSVVSYEDIAINIGMPGTSRAVGNAISRNPIPVLIPCHRVIRKSGEFGDYRWGASRKKAILGWEMAKFDQTRYETNLQVSAL